MKFKISMLFALIMSFYLNAQENIAQVEFETKLIDYGDIEFDSDGKRVFKFKNVGTAPLIFNRISSSCGCTVPKRPENLPHVGVQFLKDLKNQFNLVSQAKLKLNMILKELEFS